MAQYPRIEYLSDKAKKLPLSPGVYIMKNKQNEVIYVGKAKMLKNRVSQYFRSVEKHDVKVYNMVINVYDFDFIVTDSEYEALVLECSLIKQHSPKYNILLKDDKGYHYIEISDEEYPRIGAVKLKKDQSAKYLGPYTSSYWVKQAVDETVKAFGLPTCSRKFPQDLRKGRPCLNYHIKQCMGVCTGRVGKEEYNEIVSQAVDYIKTDSIHTVKALTEKMERAAENLEFEKAARLRDRIKAIEVIAQKQKVVMTKVDSQDAIGFAELGNQICAAVLKIRQNRLTDSGDYILGGVGNLQQTRTEFLTRYYSAETDIPKNIAIDGELEDRELLMALINEKAGRRVNLYIPRKGEQLKLVEMVRNNAAEKLSLQMQRSGREIAALDELTKLLGLPAVPEYIEAVDISHLGGENVVAGLVVFENGRPKKSAYKRFAIKSFSGQDDYGAMREVMERRIHRYFEEKQTGEGFGRLPDLILLDGGKGQVNAVLPVIESSGLAIPVFGMVKDDKHKTRAIAKNGGEIAISGYRSAFTLVSKIQDEVHRFAITYQKTKRKAAALESELTKIPGIGKAKAKSLFLNFRTIGAIRSASAEGLTKVKGISIADAQKIIAYFRGDLTDCQEKG